MIPDDLQDERRLRAWALEQAVEAVRSTTPANSPFPDFITVAQRIVTFVKGDGESKPGNGRKRS